MLVVRVENLIVSTWASVYFNYSENKVYLLLILGKWTTFIERHENRWRDINSNKKQIYRSSVDTIELKFNKYAICRKFLKLSPKNSGDSIRICALRKTDSFKLEEVHIRVIRIDVAFDKQISIFMSVSLCKLITLTI